MSPKPKKSKSVPVDVDDVAESVVGVLEAPVGVAQQVELTTDVVELVDKLHASLALPARLVIFTQNIDIIFSDLDL